MRPASPIQRENPITQQRIKLPMSRSQTKITKLRSQQRLEILRLDSVNERPREERQRDRLSVDTVLLRNEINPSLFLNRLAQADEARDTEEARSATGRGLAVLGFCLFVVLEFLGEVTQDQERGVDPRE